MGIRRNSKTIVVAAVTGVVMAGGIGAYAAIPDATGTITACYDPANPVVKVLDTATSTACPTGQQKITWNRGMKHAGPYDIAKDRANGYEIGDIVHMTAGCSQTDWAWGDGGAYIKVQKVALGASESLPCVAPRVDGTARGGWAILSRNGARGPTGPRGASGAPGPAYFVRVGANDNDTDRWAPAYRTPIRTWNYGDIVWINTPNLDVTKCTVTATPITSVANANATRLDATYKDWIGLYTNADGARSRMAVDVTIACSDQDDPSSPNN